LCGLDRSARGKIRGAMSLLQQESPEETEIGLKGEAYTKGSSHIVIAAVIATVLVAGAMVAYVLLGEKPPPVTGELLQVWAHPRHVETSGIDANGSPMPKEIVDEVLIFAHVRLHNQSKGPLLMQDVLMNSKLGGSILSISAGTAGQYDQVFLAYPEIAEKHERALSPHVIIEPGQTVEGTVFWAARMSKQEWDARKDLSFTFQFQYQPSLTLAPHFAVTEQ